MKQFIALLAMTFLFAVGCNQSTNEPASNRVNDSSNPSSSGDGPDAVFDIPTPSITDGTVSGNVDDGFCINLTWASNAPGYAEGYSSYAQDPTSPTDINDGHGWEYWGNTQLSIVIYNNGGNYNYSGHYEVYRDGEKIADVTGNSYSDCGLEAGTYVYTLKVKSREQATGDNNDRDDEATHHSAMSEGFEVSTCEEIELPPTFSINPILGAGGGNGVWNTAATMWTANSSATNQNMNMFYRMNQWNRTQNSCTGEITETLDPDGYTGDMYLSRDGGTIWRKSLPYDTDGAFHHNSNYDGGNGSGLGKFATGCHTIHWTIDPDLGSMGTFILNMNSTCTP